jgi:hypothetical protein
METAAAETTETSAPRIVMPLTEMPPADMSPAGPTAATAGDESPAWTPWSDWAPSALASHDADCCRSARAWFLAMNRSLWRGQGAPSWIGRHYAWGPTCWPLHWCDAVGAKELCCGAQAALGVEAFRDRGVDAVPVQLVQRFGEHDSAHWRGKWVAGGASAAWLGEGLVYHEACAVLDGDRARVWDPTASMWASPDEVEGYGSIAAIRIGGRVPTGRTVSWGDAELPLGEWATPPAPRDAAGA